MLKHIALPYKRLQFNRCMEGKCNNLFTRREPPQKHASSAFICHDCEIRAHRSCWLPTPARTPWLLFPSSHLSLTHTHIYSSSSLLSRLLLSSSGKKGRRRRNWEAGVSRVLASRNAFMDYNSKACDEYLSLDLVLGQDSINVICSYIYWYAIIALTCKFVLVSTIISQ